MILVNRISSWSQRYSITLLLAGLYVAACFVRAAPVIRLDYAAWWDGVGYGYADLWIGQAVMMAEGDFSALSFYSEGLLYVPLQAFLFKLLGIATGIHIWAIVLILLSAAIVPIASHTVYLVTRQPLGALFTGVLTMFDPILGWYGTNGWSDAQTFLSLAITCWAFFLCARRPTFLSMSFLSGGLATLALGHTTWLYPATLWAIVIPFLLATRGKWFPSAGLPADSGVISNWKLYMVVPLAYFAICVGVTLMVVTIGGAIGSGSEDAGLFNVDSNNQRVLVVTYDKSVEWDDWTPSDTMRVILTKFPSRFPDLLDSFIQGHVANAIHLYRWVLLSIVVAVGILIASQRHNPWPSRWGLAGLMLPAYFLLFKPGIEAPVVALTYLTIGVLWMYVPITRVLMALFAPILGILVLYLPLTTQPRHSNAIVFLFLLLAGIAIGLAAGRIREWYRNVDSYGFVLVQRVLASVVLVVLIGFGVGSICSAIGERQSESRYLEWLGAKLDDNALILTTSNVDPWQVMQITGRPVVYDVENGARLAIEPGGLEWGNDLVAEYRNYVAEADVFQSLQKRGYSLWLYTPWQGTERKWFDPAFIGSSPPVLFEVVSGANYPEQPGRAALQIGSRTRLASD